MLEQIGGECAGAVTFIPSGESLSTRKDQYRPLTNKELADILEKLPRRPLLVAKIMSAYHWQALRTNWRFTLPGNKSPYRSKGLQAHTSSNLRLVILKAL